MKRLNACCFSSWVLILLASCATIPKVPLSEVYDDFGNMKYEGSINSRLWTVSSNILPSVRQSKGELIFSTTGPARSADEKRLFSRVKVALVDIQYIGATLSLRDVASGKTGHVAINLQCQITETKELWIEANLINQGTRPVLFCKIGYFGDENFEEYAFTYDGGLEFGKKYQVRINLDGSTGTITWLLDGKKVAETISLEFLKKKGLKARFVINSYRAEGADMETSVDDALYFWSR